MLAYTVLLYFMSPLYFPEHPLSFFLISQQEFVHVLLLKFYLTLSSFAMFFFFHVNQLQHLGTHGILSSALDTILFYNYYLPL